MELITCSWQPLSLGKNIISSNQIRGHENIYRQILSGIEVAQGDKIFLAEHDVLYSVSHFDNDSTSLVFNKNIYHLSEHGYFRPSGHNFLSTLSGSKELVDKGIRSKLREIHRTGKVIWAEPIEECSTYESMDPVIDIRHGDNFTGNREAEEYIEVLPYWGHYQQHWIKNE